MTVSVLVVDDSGFFRKRLMEILTASGQIKVVGVATNGREGVELAEKLRPDVITMDYEMPILDGISAVREIMKRHPVPVLMFSSLTYEGARVTLDALEAGAVDFLPKNFEEIARDSSQLQKILVERVLDVAGSRPGVKPAQASRPAPTPAAPAR
ncbi:response regulator, partial [Marinobacter lipolyticus]|uniref:response regulator n=1 Tax=Marinobacter lipolyticus TaxID=209639 RepID=UPI001BD1B48D